MQTPILTSLEAASEEAASEPASEEAALEEALAQAAQAEPQPEIRLYGDRKTDYEHVVRVMAAAQRAGIAKLAFVTKPRD